MLLYVTGACPLHHECWIDLLSGLLVEINYPSNILFLGMLQKCTFRNTVAVADSGFPMGGGGGACTH